MVAQQVGTRVVVVFGISLAFSGYMLCYFTPNFGEMGYYIGIVHGLGMAAILPVIPELINRYFVDHRSLAQNVASVGGLFFSIFLPPLIDCLVDEYGLRGAFLIISGVVLQAFPGAILLVEPPWNQKAKPKRVFSSDSRTQKQDGKENGSVVSPNDFSLDLSLPYARTKLPFDSPPPNFIDDDDSDSYPVPPLKPTGASNVSVHTLKVMPEELSSPLMEKLGHVSGMMWNSFKSTMGNLGGVLSNPMFYIVFFSQFIFMFMFFHYFLSIGDYTMDMGVPRADAILVYSTFAIGSVLGQMVLGQIAERGLLRRRTFAPLALMSMGGVAFSLPMSAEFYMILLSSIAMGLLTGSLFPMFLAMYFEYIEEKQVLTAMTISSLVGGIFVMGTPLNMGMFRDDNCSYKNLYNLMAVMGIAVSVVWVLEPFLRRSVQQRRQVIRLIRVATIT